MPTTLDQVALAAIEASPLGFAAVDLDGRVVAWNAMAEQILGWTRDEVLGKPDPSLPSEDDGERSARFIRHLLEGGASSGGTVLQRRRSDGSDVEVAVDVFSVLGDPPQAIAFWFSVADSERQIALVRDSLAHRLVEALTEGDVIGVLGEALGDYTHDGKHAVILSPCPEGDHLHDRAWVGGGQGTIELAVDQEVVATIADAETALGEEVDAQGWEHALGGRIAPGELADLGPGLFVPMGPDGDRWVLFVVLSPERHGDVALRTGVQSLADEAWLALHRAELVGDLEAQLEILTAITAVASAAGVELATLMPRLGRIARALLNVDQVGLYLFDDAGVLRVAHVPVRGHEPGLGAGARAAELHTEAAVLSSVAPESPGTGGAPHGDSIDGAWLDAPWRPQDGAEQVLGAPLRVGGKAVGSLVVARCGRHAARFTQLQQQVAAALCQQAALAIEHARLFEREQATVVRLKELDQLKADYVAGVSHDLKTPLTSLLGFAVTLRRYGDDLPLAERARYLGSMERQARRLVAMADDLVLAGRMEQGHVSPERSDVVTPTELLLETVETFDPDRRRRIRLVDVSSASEIVGERPHLLRVLTNLLDNAFKYSPPETPIEVSIQEDAGTVAFRVRDHGDGVPPSEREAVFDRYHRGSEGRAKGSTGLGLYISRGIARGHGGDLRVEEPGEGTGAVFVLTLPTSPSSPRPQSLP